MDMLSAREISEEISYPGRFRKIRSGQSKPQKVVYPDSDGKPMADNTKQFEWIVKIKENLDRIFADDPNVFVAGDLLWYPVEGDPKIRLAPDAMVVFGRPKGHRGSYRMWEENNIAPQVVFEVLSPGNTAKEMAKKLEFYEKYRVNEYYGYDPDHIVLTGYIRENSRLCPISNMRGWTSPLLNICFEMGDDDLYIFGPDGKKFLLLRESAKQHQSELRDAELRIISEQQRADTERLRAERLAAKLRELGIEVED